jgi:hypothetical protein
MPMLGDGAGRDADFMPEPRKRWEDRWSASVVRVKGAVRLGSDGKWCSTEQARRTSTERLIPQ